MSGINDPLQIILHFNIEMSVAIDRVNVSIYNSWGLLYLCRCSSAWQGGAGARTVPAPHVWGMQGQGKVERGRRGRAGTGASLIPEGPL